MGEARDMGFLPRRTNALEILREISGRVLSRSTMRNVPDLRIPSMSHYVPTPLRLERRFQTIFEVRGTNVLTGKPSTRNVSFISDERESLGDMKRQLLERAQNEYAPREGVDYTDIVALEGLVRATAPFTEED